MANKNDMKKNAKGLNKKVKYRRILKKSTMSYSMPNKKVENIFEDENRFFKGAVENELL